MQGRLIFTKFYCKVFTLFLQVFEKKTASRLSNVVASCKNTFFSVRLLLAKLALINVFLLYVKTSRHYLLLKFIVTLPFSFLFIF